jgi:hypothetical protein
MQPVDGTRLWCRRRPDLKCCGGESHEAPDYRHTTIQRSARVGHVRSEVHPPLVTLSKPEKGSLSLLVAADRMRPVGLLELGDLLVGEHHVDGGDGVVQVAGPGRADDRRGDARLVQQPREGDLRG